ncbi:uncharacterized protein LOC132207865 isoform X1 [Stegostoma tigrinum]|uniref:uncharacterized protein LOC132207865 isoform X1 n=1 Tax=Stegostoma tigrinum TaxID=3053191 RepID=UPI00287081A4|nr:uncharacterized protein LOC132207865 isoform X1 [Stegostoma tigrinum]
MMTECCTARGSAMRENCIVRVSSSRKCHSVGRPILRECCTVTGSILGVCCTNRGSVLIECLTVAEPGLRESCIVTVSSLRECCTVEGPIVRECDTVRVSLPKVGYSIKGTTLSIVIPIVLSYQSVCIPGRLCSCGLRSCGGHGSGTAVSSPDAAEPAPEERAQRIAKAVRKQSIEVKENWEQLKIRASNWQKQVEKALEKLQELHKVLDDLEAHVITAEGVHTDWQPGKDYLQNLRLGFERQQPLFWRDNGNCRCWRMRDNNVWSWMKTAGQAASYEHKS